MSKPRKVSIKQGVFGQVLWLEGNFMPSPDQPNRSKSLGVVRDVYIYKAIKVNQTTGESPLFSNINGELVAKVKTNKIGYFQCSLAPGKYSVFTAEEDSKFFGSISDGEGYINPFEVQAGQVTRFDISINYKAAY
ncbi:MAG: carboxypeptidase regulatory-like domain-containing protein [Pedobacter sp.]|nr:MAG: carboxypeptidase regulatory-like domain-containing protein [Pedobacter sp.]